ncbi:MAG: hypothetical protein WBP86_02280 [Thiobacillaceae bacterium]
MKPDAVKGMILITRYLTKPYWDFADPNRGNRVHNFHHYAKTPEHEVDTVNDAKHGAKFWIGNALLTLAFACLFFMATLSSYMGAWAMVLWVALAAAGFYLLTADKGNPTNSSD